MITSRQSENWNSIFFEMEKSFEIRFQIFLVEVSRSRGEMLKY